MKYANILTDNDLLEIYKLFIGSEDDFVSLEITRFNNSINLDGVIKIEDPENPNEMIEIDDCYEISDYNVKVYDHSGSIKKIYRKYMYNRFGNKYAEDFLLG